MRKEINYLLLVYLFILFCVLRSNKVSAQPFVDIVSASTQQLKSSYVGSQNQHFVRNTFIGVLLPIAIDSSNLFIARINGEKLHSETIGFNSNSNSLYVANISVGWQHTFKKKLSVTALLMPKIASELNAKLNSKDFQFGTSLLFQYQFSEKLKVKAGLYYNREPFGNFFVPLVGIDWQISKRWMLYGTFPLMNKIEFMVTNFLYTGIGARVYGRSYRLNQSYNYVWNQENQIKYFIDFYVLKKIVIYGEVGRTLGYSPTLYGNNKPRENAIANYQLYTPINDDYFFNVGMAFRIRKPM